VARNRNNASLPEQKSAESPQVKELLARALKAFHAGQLAGDPESAAALFMQALKEKPDSRRAVQGLFDVRARLVAEIDQDIAVGDVDAAKELLDALRTLPNAEQEVAQLEENLKTLATVRPMLAAAAALLQQGKADQPKGDNALELYHQVQQLDPQNAVAEQGIFQVQRAVLDRALAAVAQNDFAGAEKQLARAQAIRPGSQQMHDVRHRRIPGRHDVRAVRHRDRDRDSPERPRRGLGVHRATVRAQITALCRSGRRLFAVRGRICRTSGRHQGRGGPGLHRLRRTGRGAGAAGRRRAGAPLRDSHVH